MTQFEDLKKQEFSHLTSHYFNSAYFGPLPQVAHTAALKALERARDPSYLSYEWFYYPDELKQAIAQLTNWDPEWISLHSSVGEGVSAIANGYPTKEQVGVAFLTAEYSSNVLPFTALPRNSHFKVHFIDNAKVFEPQSFVDSLPSDVKMVVVSWVQFQTGNVIDIAKIGSLLQSRGIRFVVDLTQGLGGQPIPPESVPYVDAFVCATYKWLLGPYGSAFVLWKKSFAEQIEPSAAHWQLSLSAPKDQTQYFSGLRPGARKFDRGQTGNPFVIKPLIESLRLLKQVGLGPIQQHNTQLRQYFLEHFPFKKYELLTQKESSSHIVCLNSRSGDAENLLTQLNDRKIDATIRMGRLRLSFHLYNSQVEVEKLIEALDACKI